MRFSAQRLNKRPSAQRRGGERLYLAGCIPLQILQEYAIHLNSYGDQHLSTRDIES